MPDTTINCTVNVVSIPYFARAMCTNSRNICSLLVVMTEGKRNIIQQLLQEYDIQSAEDIQEALKDLLGGTIKEMMEAEMDEHLGYQKSQRRE